MTYTGSTVANNGSSCYTHTTDLNGIVVTGYAKDTNGASSTNTGLIANIDATVPGTPTLSCSGFVDNVTGNYAGTTICSISNS